MKGPFGYHGHRPHDTPAFHEQLLANQTGLTFADAKVSFVGPTSRRAHDTPEKKQWAGLPPR